MPRLSRFRGVSASLRLSGSVSVSSAMIGSPCDLCLHYQCVDYGIASSWIWMEMALWCPLLLGCGYVVVDDTAGLRMVSLVCAEFCAFVVKGLCNGAVVRFHAQ